MKMTQYKAIVDPDSELLGDFYFLRFVSGKHDFVVLQRDDLDGFIKLGRHDRSDSPIAFRGFDPSEGAGHVELQIMLGGRGLYLYLDSGASEELRIDKAFDNLKNILGDFSDVGC